MELLYYKEEVYNKKDWSGGVITGEYDGCKFNGCNFSNANLSRSAFHSCVFTSCNLSLAQLKRTGFTEVQFTDCKMLGLHLGDCDTFNLSFRFENCILDHSSFYKLKIRNSLFLNVKLIEVDFSEADLSGATFENCDLLNASFDRTNIEKADFTTAYNYRINPQTNRMRKAKFSLAGIEGLLQHLDIEIIH